MPCLYTSKKGVADAVKMSGNTDMYAAIYAPLGRVNIAASGDLMGFVRGNTITVSGAAGIHYDEALADVGSRDDAAKAEFNSIYYHYPNQ